MVTAAGGAGVWVQVDHSRPDQVRSLFERIKDEQKGRLDILVNDISGDSFSEWDKWEGKWNEPFWELTLEKGLQMQMQGVHTHIITAYYGIPLMIPRRSGLIIELTDGFRLQYRGRLFYDLAKVSAIRLAYGMSEELRGYNIAAVALTPGYLRSEEMLHLFGVTEANWRDGIPRDPNFEKSESPYFVGEVAAALAADPNVMDISGHVLGTGCLAEQYELFDADGRRPLWYRGKGVFAGGGFQTSEID
jgi:NAD(P)-dependent dehydrogenase (short-subunit alcohol dehydrogenase family)